MVRVSRGRLCWGRVDILIDAPHKFELQEMADYWKSQPRHFCEICKCWFGDNRACRVVLLYGERLPEDKLKSIDFHERGKRHQANVERHLREARKKTSEKEKEAAETAKTLEKIERAALNAYYKDLHDEVGLPTSQPITQQEQQQLKKQQQKEQAEFIEQHIQKLARSKLNSTATVPSSTIVPPPPPPSPWQQLSTPEGYSYYCNIITGVSQWEPPPEFQQSQIPDTCQQSTTEQPADSGEASASEHSTGQKRTAEEADLEKLYEPPKRAAGPYGSWTTVAERDGNSFSKQIGPQQEKKKEMEEEEEEDEKDITEEQKGMKFEEKQLPSEETTPGSFKGFAFKKRTGGAQKRPQIRERTSQI